MARDARQQADFVLLILFGCVGAHANHAEHRARVACQQWHGKHALIRFLKQVGKEFEARMAVSGVGNRDGLAFLRHPADDALTRQKSYLVHEAGIVTCGGAQHQFRACLVVQEDVAHIGLGDARGDVGDGLQHAFGGERAARGFANAAQRLDLRLAVCQPML